MIRIGAINIDTSHPMAFGETLERKPAEAPCSGEHPLCGSGVERHSARKRRSAALRHSCPNEAGFMSQLVNSDDFRLERA